jgi:alkaline phosphatase D
MARELDRREFLGYAGIGTGALILGGIPVDPLMAKRVRRRRVPFARGGSFPQSVAAGSPQQRSVSLWTRLDGFTRDRRLRVEVARDPDFRRVVARKVVRARADRDHTVETRIASKRLQPGSEYFYRFETRDESSPVGRFRTKVPGDSREPVRIVFYSCQDWQAGFFGAHSAIAREDADLVVCLGDYVYERNIYEGPRKDTLGANRDGEVQTLPEYRAKYRMYKADPDLRAMHEAHAFAAVWDDHEVEDNYAGFLPGGKTMDRRIPFPQRRANGYRSFYEYMPFGPLVGRPEIGNDLYRRIRMGSNVELFLLDERQYRDDQPCNDVPFVPCPEAEAEPRRYLGERQLSWLKRRLRASGGTWKLVANQLMIMALDAPQGNGLNKDTWDGYGYERRDLLRYVSDKGIRNLAFLTGDIHTFFAGDVGIDGRGPESVATEFVGGSLTSLGIADAFKEGAPALSEDQIRLITENLRLANPHLRYEEQRSRGYGVLEASQSELKVEFKAVDALTRNSDARTIGRFRVASGSPRVEVL